MAFFAPSHFNPLFTLLSAPAYSAPSPRCYRPVRAFQPRFDVHEDSNAFHLYGELPGVPQDAINIEFTDHNTIVIRGRHGYNRNSGSADSDAASTPSTTTTITDEHQISEKEKADVIVTEEEVKDDASVHSGKSHQATVEDDDEEYVDASMSDVEPTPLSSKAPTTASNETVAAPKPEQAEEQTSRAPRPKKWVSERVVGTFSRSFTFPGRVNQEKVKASLKDGLLTIVIPKRAEEKRRIAIE